METKALLENLQEPKYVWYAGQPPALGGKPRKVSVKKLEALIGNNFKFSENVYYHSEQENKFDEANIQTAESLKLLGEKIANKPFNDKLVICYIDENVGHGVFAREDIEINEVLAIYAGEIKQYASNQYKIEYCLELNEVGEKDEFYIDAKHIGGIARFMQHLPYNPKKMAEAVIAELKEFPRRIDQFVDLILQAPDDKPLKHHEIEQAKNNFYIDTVQGKGQLITNMLNYQIKEKQLVWELDSIRLHNIKEEQIAWSNTTHCVIKIEGVPVKFVYATQRIKKHEQIGFNYGVGYWLEKNELPALFSKKGNIIPKKYYQYTQLPVYGNFQGKNLGYFYSVDQYKQDQCSRFPMQVGPGTAPISFFNMRKKLAKHGLINSKHSPLHLNSFAVHLQQLLPDDLSIELFNRFPEDSSNNGRNIADIVVTAPTIERWGQLFQLFKNNVIVQPNEIAQSCKCFQYTKEILIESVNNESNKFTQFINTLHEKKDAVCNLFKSEIPKNLLPKEPEKTTLYIKKS